MSILTQLLEGKLTFGQASQEAAKWAETLVSHDPTLTATAGAVLSDVKQAASNAVEMADGALGQYLAPASSAVETALEGALASVTKGASIPFNPLISDAIDRISGAIKAEADAWALKTKSQIAQAGATNASLVIPPAPEAPAHA